MGNKSFRWIGVAVVAAMVSLHVVPVFAEELRGVIYAGGSSNALTIGTEGRLDLSTTTALTFKSEKAGVLTESTIPYEKIRHFEHRSEVAHHLGVLPAIAVG